MRLKRKDLDEDFSDFSISSPATKIRRLDAELPIMESETPARVPEIEEATENEERALVVFNPITIITSPLSSSHRFSVDSDIIAGFKNNYPWSPSSLKISEIEEEEQREDEHTSCTAVVPWVAPTQPWNICQQADEEMGEADMDIEQEYTNNTDSTTAATMVDEQRGGYPAASGWHHCLIPQFPPNTPLTWYQ